MGKPEPLIPPAKSPIGYFWTIQGDWNLAAKIGLVTLVMVTAFAWLSGPGHNQNLNESFRVATANLQRLTLEKPAEKRTSRLTKKGKKESWCGVVNVREGSEINPYIWTAEVERNGDIFTCTESGLWKYDPEMAERLGLSKVFPN